MSRKSFSELLQKYSEGKCTPEEKQLVEHWYGLLDNTNSNQIESSDTDALEERMWDGIQAKMYEIEPVEEPKTVFNKWVRFGWASMAASLLIIGTWFLWKETVTENWTANTTSNQESDWVEQRNTSAGTITIHLEDGSSVKLSSNALLRFPKHFSAQKREVHLQGNAFFDIQKQPSRPFFVYSGDVVTKVLGTSFFVRTEAKTKEIKVEVVTGRVAVYRQSKEKQSPTDGVILTPNHAATYFDEQKHFVTGLVENPVILPKATTEQTRNNLRFDDTPLSEVLKKLEEAYGIEFTVENDKQNNCLLTANLANQSLYNQLNLICAALHAQYEIQGTTILLSGNGCD